MAADQGRPNPSAEFEAEPEEETPPPPKTHKVARSTPGDDLLNTIDLFGEKPFSV